MRWMLKLLLVLSALWSGYWYLGFTAQKQLYSNLLETGRSQGWVAESQDLAVLGYPDRFDTTLNEFSFQTPDKRWGWSGDSFQIKALSYRLNHLALAWQGRQNVQTPEGSFGFEAGLFLADLVFSPDANLPLSRLQLEGEAIDISIPSGLKADITTLNADVFQDGTTPTRYQLDLDLRDISLPPTFVSSILPGRSLSGIVERIHISAQLDFDREIDRTVLGRGSAPAPVFALIEPSQIRWGNAGLTVEGELSAANNGYIEGRLSFDVSNWPPLFEAFKAMSNLSATQRITLKRALDSASSQGRLQFTLQFENGQTRIGPFAIGPAPIYPF